MRRREKRIREGQARERKKEGKSRFGYRLFSKLPLRCPPEAYIAM
jgi:hypothetical protein